MNKKEEVLPAILTMELTPDMEKELVDLFDIEVEILQGTRKMLPDGRARIVCTINDKGKYDMMREFALKVIANSQQKVNPN